MNGDDKKTFGELSLEPMEGDTQDDNPFGERSGKKDPAAEQPKASRPAPPPLPDTGGLSLQPLDSEEPVSGKADFSINDRDSSERRLSTDRRGTERVSSARRLRSSRRADVDS